MLKALPGFNIKQTKRNKRNFIPSLLPYQSYSYKTAIALGMYFAYHKFSSKTEKVYAFNTILRDSFSRRKSLVGKSVPNYLVIPLNRNLYYGKEQSYVKSNCKAHGITYDSSVKAYEALLTKPIFSSKPGWYHYGKDGNGDITIDSQTTQLFYVGLDNDSFFTDESIDAETRSIVYLLFAEYLDIRGEKKIDKYQEYKKQFVGYNVITHDYDYKDSSKTDTKTPAMEIANDKKDNWKLQKINNYYNRHLGVEVGSLFHVTRKWRLERSVYSGGRLYSKFHSMPSNTRNKFLSILGYKEQDATSFVMRTMYVYQFGNCVIKRDQLENFKHDYYTDIMQHTSVFQSSKNTDIYRPLAKYLCSVLIGSGGNKKQTVHLFRKKAAELGYIYSDEEKNALSVLKQDIISSNEYYQANPTHVYFDPSYRQLYKELAKQRKSRLTTKHPLSQKKITLFAHEAIDYLLSTNPLLSTFSKTYQEIESDTSLEFMLKMIDRNQLPLSCHDAVFYSNTKDYSQLYNQVLNSMILFHREKDRKFNTKTVSAFNEIKKTVEYVSRVLTTQYTHMVINIILFRLQVVVFDG